MAACKENRERASALGKFTIGLHRFASSAKARASARDCGARPGRDSQTAAFVHRGMEPEEVASHVLPARECDREPATRTHVANPPAPAIAAGT